MIRAFTRHGWLYEPRAELLHDGYGYMWERRSTNPSRPDVATRRYVPSNRPTRAMVVRAFTESR